VMGYSGDRLEEVTAEVETLTGLFPEADLLSETEATAERLLADAPRYRILHLAAHARFRADNVMLSSLSLANRRLTLGEVARLRLGADLVTLSGCETGRGRLHGADLISLACGFLGAGARSLLVSLWRVDDATAARLMDAFYRALRGGEGRASALRTAQLELLSLGHERPAEYGAYRHPAYWAPFVLIGEWGRLSGLPGRSPACPACPERDRGKLFERRMKDA
jgi:CHAT domain-containing protein